MERTRKSLYYVAGYLYFGGAGFLLYPPLMLDLFFAEGIYSEVTLRVIGALMLTLAILITGIIERRAETLYRQTILARIPAILCLGFVYWYSLDQMWLFILVIVTVGWLISVISYAADRRSGNVEKRAKG